MRTRELVLRHAAGGGVGAGAGGGRSGVAGGQSGEPVLDDCDFDQVEAELLDPLHAHRTQVNVLLYSINME